jgi:hypothetical protein
LRAKSKLIQTAKDALGVFSPKGFFVPEKDANLAVEIAGLSIGAHLDRAIVSGNIARRDDGTLSRAEIKDDTSGEILSRQTAFIGKVGATRRMRRKGRKSRSETPTCKPQWLDDRIVNLVVVAQLSRTRRPGIHTEA